MRAGYNGFGRLQGPELNDSSMTIGPREAARVRARSQMACCVYIVSSATASDHRAFRDSDNFLFQIVVSAFGQHNDDYFPGLLLITQGILGPSTMDVWLYYQYRPWRGAGRRPSTTWGQYGGFDISLITPQISYGTSYFQIRSVSIFRSGGHGNQNWRNLVTTLDALPKLICAALYPSPTNVVCVVYAS